MYSNNQWDVQEQDYTNTSSFVIRVINILILFAAWVCAAAALDHGTIASPDLQSTRVAFLIFSLIAFVECIVILVASLNDIVIEILYIVLDALMLVLLAIVSIAAIVRDTQVNNGSISGAEYRYGSLAAAAVFGFISVVLFIELVTLYTLSLISEGFD